MSLMGGPIPSSLGAGGLNRDFAPHGLVTWSRSVLFQLEACVQLEGRIHTSITLTGEARSAAQLNAQVHTAVTAAGRIRDAVQLSGETNTLVALLGEIGDCD